LFVRRVLDELAPQQRRFNIFREEFNEERPHGALKRHPRR
jgi:hypothetical protein